MSSTSTSDEGFPIRCDLCGSTSTVNVSRPPGDSVCPSCGAYLWVQALVEKTRENSFEPDLRIRQLAAAHRDDAIREISRGIAEALQWGLDHERVFVDALIEREELGSTAIGRGFAMPHAKVDWVEGVFTAMAFAPKGIDFLSLDLQKVHTIVVIASPLSRPGDHLRILERVSRSLYWLRRH